jgi:hypothetical protein
VPGEGKAMATSGLRTIGRLAVGAGLSGLLGVVVAASPAAATSPTNSCVGTTCTVTFTYTGGLQSWSVPAGVTSANFDVLGASGGSLPGTGQPVGGLGGETKGTLSVSPGDLYFIYVGGKGTNQSSSATASQAGGFNGGAAGGGPAIGSAGAGASGGWASDVRSGGSLSSRLLVAGGGGGAASAGTSPVTTGNGGAGGGTTGGNGNGEAIASGAGGTPSAGGAAGAGGSAAGTGGVLGAGGAGGVALSAGGGGGYYGGGGGGFDPTTGAYGPGGGGSSHTAPTVANAVLTSGIQSGNGQVVITYVDDDLAIAGVPSDITATATDASGAIVTFTPPVALDPDDAVPPVVTCSASSGATFPIGTTMVTCTATDPDDIQGTVTAVFTITVDPAPVVADAPTVLVGATDAHTGEPWAGSQPLVAGALALGTTLLVLGTAARRRTASRAKAARN